MNEPEIEEREDIETGKQRTILHRNIGYTWLTWIAVVALSAITATSLFISFVVFWYGIPAAKEFKEAQSQTSNTYRNFLPDLTRRLEEKDKKIDAILTNTESITGDSARTTKVIAENAPKLFESFSDLSKAGVSEIRSIGNETRSFIKNGNQSLFGEQGLFVALTDTTKRGGDMISNQDKSLQALASEGKATIAELREIAKSDEWKQIRGEMLKSMQNTASLTKHADDIAIHTDETVIEGRDLIKLLKEYMKTYAPGILASLEKISQEASKLQKATLLANIFRLLAIGLGAL
jgi:hypothetical protein